MQRRKFLQAAGLTAMSVSPALAGLKPATEKIRWKMVTAWPKNLPGPGVSANQLAERIRVMSAGRLDIKVYAAGELVPPFEVFGAVSAGTAEMGHAAAHYWAGKTPAASFFAGIPFGMTANEMNAWLYHGGGLALWRELYEPFGLIPMPAGNAGMQMAGWYRKPITSVKDFKGLKIRIAGLGGEVLRRLGAVPVTMPPGEVFTALQTGALDAAEFVGPYTDLPLGLYKIAKLYYTPGWSDPGSPLECTLNKAAFEQLPDDLQAVVTNACQAENNDLLAAFTAGNAVVLQSLVQKHGVKLSYLPESVLSVLKEKTGQVLADIAEEDVMTSRVFTAYQQFARQVAGWTTASELSYLKTRLSV